MSSVFRSVAIFTFVCIFSGSLMSRAVAQDTLEVQPEIHQWLAEQESLTLSVALEKLSRLIEMNQSGYMPEEDLSEIPEELRQLLATPSSFNIEEQKNQLLYGDSTHKGLLESVEELTIADYNKFVLILSLLYRDAPDSRADLESLAVRLEALYEHSQNNNHMRPGHNIADKAFFAVGLLFITRTAFHAGKSMLKMKWPWSRLSPATRGSQLYIGTSAKLPVALNQTALQRTQSFLQSRKGILSLHAGAAVIGGIYGGAESYFYFLQTQKVSPLESLRFIQADLACELAMGSIDFRRSTAQLNGLVDLTVLEEMSVELEAAARLNQTLSQSYGMLSDLWTKDQPGWQNIRTSLEDELNTQGPALSCERISSENIGLDLDQARFNIQQQLRRAIVGLPASEGSGILEMHANLVNIHADWLITQDDLLDRHAWLREYLLGVGR